nr:MAG: capsid protein [Solemoviridae sp.]
MAKCPVCRKVFKDKAKLKTHVSQAHTELYGNYYPQGAGKAIGPSVRRNRGVPVSSSTTTTYGSEDVALSGVDRLTTVEIGTGSKGSLYETVITTQLVARLRAVASAFQRIRYQQMEFEIVAKSSSMNSGGYTAGFVPDALEEGVDLIRLVSMRGATTAKIWETKRVACHMPATKFYTSSHGGDLRLASPGKFYIFMDGSANQTASLTVNLKWRVVLSAPGLEPMASEFRIKTGVVVRVTPDRCHLSKWDGTTEDWQVQSFLEPTPPNGVILRCLFQINIEYFEGTGDTGTLSTRFIEISGGVAYLRNGPKKETWKENGNIVKWQKSVESPGILFGGDILHLHQQSENKSGSLKEPSFGLPVTSGSGEIINGFNSGETSPLPTNNCESEMRRMRDCLNRLEERLNRLSDGSMTSRQTSWERLPSLEKPIQMVSTELTKLGTEQKEGEDQFSDNDAGN